MSRTRLGATWHGQPILSLSATAPDEVERVLAAPLLNALPGRELALARRLPLVRRLASERWTERTALTGAAYTAARYLGGESPRVGSALGEEDVHSLTLEQAVLAYRISIAYGLPWDWQRDSELPRQALDVSLLWRETARSIVGLLPLWNPRARVALAYGATLALGRGVEQWCARSSAVSPLELRRLGADAGTQSRAVGREVWERARSALVQSRGERLRLERGAAVQPEGLCPACAHGTPVDATFCSFCGRPLAATQQRSSG